MAMSPELLSAINDFIGAGNSLVQAMEVDSEVGETQEVAGAFSDLEHRLEGMKRTALTANAVRAGEEFDRRTRELLRQVENHVQAQA